MVRYVSHKLVRSKENLNFKSEKSKQRLLKTVSLVLTVMAVLALAAIMVVLSDFICNLAYYVTKGSLQKNIR